MMTNRRWMSWLLDETRHHVSAAPWRRGLRRTDLRTRRQAA
jgi:hypothetical protein